MYSGNKLRMCDNPVVKKNVNKGHLPVEYRLQKPLARVDCLTKKDLMERFK